MKKKLADARSSAQSEREARANLEAKHAMHVAALEKQLNAALAAPQSAPREAELERTAAQARKACWEAEARAKSSDATCIKLRDELAECKLRLVGIEDEGRLAAEMRLAHVAEAAEMHAVEASLRRELEAAQSESSAARRPPRLPRPRRRALRLDLARPSPSWLAAKPPRLSLRRRQRG